MEDLILIKMKILVGCYQGWFRVLEEFAFIKWPQSLTLIGKYTEMVQLNILQIAPIHCLFPNLEVGAFGRLYTRLNINAGAIILGFSIYGVRKVLLTRKTFEHQEEYKRRKFRKQNRWSSEQFSSYFK